MPTEMMTLGEFPFRVLDVPLDEIERFASWRWAALEGIGARPAWQYLGPGQESVTLNGVSFPAHAGRTDPAAALRAEAGRGEPLRLMGGEGRVLGMWAVRRIEERRTQLIDSGAPRRVEYRIELALHSPAAAQPRSRIAAEDSGVSLEGPAAAADLQRIELLRADVREQLNERVSAIDRAKALARKGASLRDALERTAGSQAQELYSLLDKTGLGKIPRRLWGPSELMALAPDIPGEQAVRRYLP